MQRAALLTDALPIDIVKVDDAWQARNRFGKVADVVIIAGQFDIEWQTIEEFLILLLPPVNPRKRQRIFQPQLVNRRSILASSFCTGS